MENSKTVKIIVATHKKYRMPADRMYLPLHVGAKGKVDSLGNPLELGYTRDDTGDNISEKNAGYCELTGLYWAWKHIGADYIGLVHYRRHFLGKKRKDVWDCVLRYEDIEPWLGRIKVFTPKKRKYYIETLYSHYAHTHYASHLDTAREVIKEKYPEYAGSFDRVVRQTYGYMFNMMIMTREYFDRYCSWLFDILFELEKRIDMQELSLFQRRYYGRISEIIFNVWLDYQIRCGNIKRDEMKEIPCIHMEKTDWKKKGTAFFKAKFLHVKYEGSF